MTVVSVFSHCGVRCTCTHRHVLCEFESEIVLQKRRRDAQEEATRRDDQRRAAIAYVNEGVQVQEKEKLISPFLILGIPPSLATEQLVRIRRLVDSFSVDSSRAYFNVYFNEYFNIYLRAWLDNGGGDIAPILQNNNISRTTQCVTYHS